MTLSTKLPVPVLKQKSVRHTLTSMTSVRQTSSTTGLMNNLSGYGMLSMRTQTMLVALSVSLTSIR